MKYTPSEWESLRPKAKSVVTFGWYGMPSGETTSSAMVANGMKMGGDGKGEGVNQERL
jgi:hypothetical protein